MISRSPAYLTMLLGLAAAVALSFVQRQQQIVTATRLCRDSPRIAIQRDDDAGALTISIDDREALQYQYGEAYAIPHYWPLRSPSGKLLTVQHPEPYPHHRSAWIADKVQLEDGPIVDLYHSTQNLLDPDRPEKGYRHFIRHVKFTKQETSGTEATIEATLRWIVDGETPVLDESRMLRIVALGEGEYFLDLTWTLTASYGDVTFHSDWVHYAWPYIRMHPQFSGQNGGTLIDDQGRSGQQTTNGQYAKWIDYFNTIEGVTEGLAMFIFPDGGKRKWLTREYGTFGPRRIDALSGTGFVIEKGESIEGRVGILVHRGDVETGRVAERYEHYVEGEL